jgi:two-component system response regulator MtrA
MHRVTHDAVPLPRRSGAEAVGCRVAVGGEHPLVVAVSSDPGVQRELIRRLDGLAVVIVATDLPAAAAVLGQLDRRAQLESSDLLRPGDLVIDRRRRQVTWRDEEMTLTHHEYELLSVLASDVGRVWSHEQLHLQVWRTRFIKNASALHSSVKRLRRKFEAAGVPLRIQAVRGVGFRLVPASDLPS